MGVFCFPVTQVAVGFTFQRYIKRERSCSASLDARSKAHMRSFAPRLITQPAPTAIHSSDEATRESIRVLRAIVTELSERIELLETREALHHPVQRPTSV